MGRPPSLTAEMKSIPGLSVEEMADRLGQADFFVFDNNPPRRWAAGHLKGARNLDPADHTDAELPSDKAATLLFHCSEPTCGACRFAAGRARQMGYINVFVMLAGINGWQEAGNPVEKG